MTMGAVALSFKVDATDDEQQVPAVSFRIMVRPKAKSRRYYDVN
jgi:hypothetical protein